MVIFEKVRWKNFLSTGNQFNEIDIISNHSTLIVGKNGGGKSTMLDAICFVLFNKPFRNIKKNQLINSINLKNTVVEIEFSSNNNNYKVIRGIKPNLFEIQINGVILNKDAASRDYQEVLENQILKMNYKTFTQVIILGSSSFTPFMELNAPARREIVEDILDIKIFSNMNNLIKERISATKQNLLIVDGESKTLLSKAEAQAKLINYIKKQKESYSLTLNEETITLQHNKIEKETEICEILSKMDKIDISGKDVVLKEIELDYNLVKELKYKERELNKKSDFYKTHKNCPTCSKEITEDERNNNEQSVTGELTNIITEIFKLENSINLKKLKITEIEERERQYSELKSKKQTIQFQISSIESDILNNTRKQTIGISKLEEDETKEKSILKDIIVNMEAVDNKKKGLLQDRKIETNVYNLLKDDGIKSAIINEYLPIINTLINKFLTLMDCFIRFELDENFQEKIFSRYRDDFSYTSFSEGEKVRINLAILFTWRQIAKMKNSANTNLLILDEIFDGSLDDQGIEYFIKILEEFTNNNIFVISHKGEKLFDKFDDVIRFNKVNNYSVMEVLE